MTASDIYFLRRKEFVTDARGVNEFANSTDEEGFNNGFSHNVSCFDSYIYTSIIVPKWLAKDISVGALIPITSILNEVCLTYLVEGKTLHKKVGEEVGMFPIAINGDVVNIG